nr:MAG TPA: zinc-ribbon domain protein [Caudoviricetes sp.]
MKILKKPVNNYPIEFACDSCGCEFEAENGEYRVDSVGLALDKAYMRVLKCNCPICGYSECVAYDYFRPVEEETSCKLDEI